MLRNEKTTHYRRPVRLYFGRPFLAQHALARPLWLLCLSVLLAACSSGTALLEDPGPPQVEASYTVVGDSLEGDAAMEALVAPYRAQLAEQMDRVLAQAPAPLTKGTPEGDLGNLAADAMLAEAERLTGEDYDLAVGNNGGLRVPIAAGPVTLGSVFELMPFENFLVVQELTAAEVDTLAQQLARAGGEPVAGLSFVIREGQAQTVRVQGQPVEADRTYRLVTHNYLAYGGGEMPVLWGREDVTRELPLSLREAFVRYFERLGTLQAPTSGRITRQ